MANQTPTQTPDPSRPTARNGGDSLLGWIVLGIIAGAVAGGLNPQLGNGVAFLGDIFLRALKMIVVPLVTLSIVVGITGLGDVRKLGSIGRRTILYYLTTTALAVLLGMLLVAVIRPGSRIDVSDASMVDRLVGKEGASVTSALRDMLVGLLPENVIAAAAETQVLPLIIFSLCFGAVLTTMGRRSEPLIALFGVANDAIMTMVHVIMKFAPVGIGCLVAGRLAEAGGFVGFWPELQAVLRYALTVILGLFLHGTMTLPAALLLFGQRSAIAYAKACSGALVTAFSTASSSATLPLTFECTTEKAGVSPRTSSFVLPLGATINMDGTALYEAVAAIFIAEAFGIVLDPAQYIIIFLTSTLAAIGAAGIPEAGLVTMIIVLNSVGLPVEGISLILAIDWFLDRCRTTVNVWGDAVGAAVIDRFEQADLLAAAGGQAPVDGEAEPPLD